MHLKVHTISSFWYDWCNKSANKGIAIIKLSLIVTEALKIYEI